MKKKLLVPLLMLLCASAKAQLFSQSFSSSTVVNDYIGTDKTNQFEGISTTSTTYIDVPTNTVPFLTTSITGNALRFNRPDPSSSGSNTVNIYAYRNYSFATKPTFVQLKLDFNLSGTNALNKGNGAINILLGSDYTAATSGQSYATRIGINTQANNGEYKVTAIDNLDGVPQSAVLTGKTTITFIANNSGSDKTYLAPDGTTESIASGKMEFWVGTTKVRNDFPIKTTTNPIDGFKISSANTINLYGILDFDNISFTDLGGTAVLPISLKSFSGKGVDKSVLLNWCTASEKNNRNFEILRSSDGKTFKSIGSVLGAINSDKDLFYSFSDTEPDAGINYYSLKQIDLDGKINLSQVISVDSKIDDIIMTVYADDDKYNVTIVSPKPGNGVLVLYDINGRKLSSKDIRLDKGYNKSVLNADLNTGVYILTLASEGKLFKQKILR